MDLENWIANVDENLKLTMNQIKDLQTKYNQLLGYRKCLEDIVSELDKVDEQKLDQNF